MAGLENFMSDENVKSFLHVQFADIASVLFSVQIENVTPLQLLAIAGYLELRAKNELVRQENEKLNRDAEMKLIVPDKHVQVANHIG